MDYNALAREYMMVLYKMRKRKRPTRINDSLHGEQFVLAFLSRHDGRVIPGDISMASVDEVRAFASGGSARVQR